MTPRCRGFRRASLAAALALAACRTPAERALDRLLDDAEQHGGRVGVVVLDAADGRRLVAHAPDDGFVPASNQKLLTAAVALRTLGPEGTLRTELCRTGPVQGSELRGDLLLRGGGDPSFGGATRLDALVAAVRALGVRRVAGRVRGDGSWLGDERHGRGWEWQDLGEEFAAPFGGLCCDGNVERRVDAAGERRVPVADPAVSAAAALRVRLEAAGIEVGDGDGYGGDPLPIATDTSPPLTALLVRLLADSDNLTAEQLWRAAARTAVGDGSTDAAAAHARRELAALGVDVRGLVLADGSGLSRLDLVRPSQIAGLLHVLHGSPWLPALTAALPRGGESGTLRTRFTAGPARGAVFAKTGTLLRVTGLSGYLARPQGAPWVFCVLWNDFQCDDVTARDTVDAFVQRLAVAAGW